MPCFLNCIAVSYDTILIFIHSINTVCYIRKSIHICFSLKKGRSDTTSLTLSLT